jgi:ABC-type uncharacterized transport system permease subunit
VNKGLVVTLIISGIAYGTPLLLGALGELLAERSGVMNLGLEGMFLVSAVSAFWVSQRLSGPAWLVICAAVIVAIATGALMALVHAFLTITLRANQIMSGLALTILGGATGLSSYFAQIGNLGGQLGHHQLGNIDVLGLKGLPVVGPILFHQDVIVYLSWVLVVVAALYLYRSRFGLHLRAVGEEPQAADAMGINVTAYRYVHVIVGGALAGIAGSYYTLVISPTWTNGLTAGAGWIAIGLTILAFWNPWFVLVGAYFFGAVLSLGFILQARGVNLPPEVFTALPYLMTIVVLVLVSTALSKRRLGAPSALGVPYVRDEH